MPTNLNASWGAGADKFTSKINHNYYIQFVSGFGQFHSNETTATYPKPYVQIDIFGIRQLIDNPPQKKKSELQWLIASIFPSRNFKEQEKYEQYYLLWADIDKNAPDFDKLVEIIKSILPGHEFEAYTTSSATEDNQKARLLIPVDKPLSFDEWTLCQQILNDHFRKTWRNA